MVEWSILSGSQAGRTYTADFFPISLGRGAADNIRLEDAGVWESHFRMDLAPDNSFAFATPPQAPILHNGTAAVEGMLKNGDLVDIGAVKLRFSISSTTQRSLRAREAVVWLMFAGFFGLEGYLLFWLLKNF